MSSRGKIFRELVESARAEGKVLQVTGAINAYCAQLAEFAGSRALYVSGSGVATASHGLPDLGITTLHDVVEDVRRITSATSLPLLVDIDTGFGSAFNIQRTVRELEGANAAAVHIEDQVPAKRCGHRPNKSIVSTQEMVDRIKCAVDARSDPNFVIMARTDSYANEGMEGAIERSLAYIEAGADMIFAEALTSLEEYKTFTKAVKVPVLANITEFGKTPLFTADELASAGVSIALYPLSAFRAMSAAALKVYKSILEEGTQKSCISEMQPRSELYEVIKYHDYERKLDEILSSKKEEKTE